MGMGMMIDDGGGDGDGMGMGTGIGWDDGDRDSNEIGHGNDDNNSNLDDCQLTYAYIGVTLVHRKIKKHHHLHFVSSSPIDIWKGFSMGFKGHMSEITFCGFCVKHMPGFPQLGIYSISFKSL